MSFEESAWMWAYREIHESFFAKDKEIAQLRELITELADALETFRTGLGIYGPDDPLKLIQRAREATK